MSQNDQREYFMKGAARRRAPIVTYSWKELSADLTGFSTQNQNASAFYDSAGLLLYYEIGNNATTYKQRAVFKIESDGTITQLGTYTDAKALTTPQQVCVYGGVLYHGNSYGASDRYIRSWVAGAWAAWGGEFFAGTASGQISFAHNGTTGIAMFSSSSGGVYYLAARKRTTGAWSDASNTGWEGIGATVKALENRMFVVGTTICVAYRDTVSGKINCLYWNGTTWAAYGTANFANCAKFSQPILDLDGKPCIAVTYGTTLSVWRLSSGTWSKVGSDVDADMAGSLRPSLSVDTDGGLVVAYIGLTSGPTYASAYVQKYDGANWAPVGTTKFNSNADGEIFVAVVDGVPLCTLRNLNTPYKVSLWGYTVD